MKKIILAISLTLASTAASAACFNFINAKGPDRIGNYTFAGPAEGVCFNTTNRFGSGTYTSVRFYDRQGDLAVASAQVNGSVIQLTTGNINGDNVNLAGTEISIDVQEDSSLKVSKGILSVKAGRDFPQKFLIISVSK